MLMKKTTHTKIIDEIKNTDELRAIEIILNGKSKSYQCSVILNDELFSWGYETTFTNDFLAEIKNSISGKDTILLKFIDTDLPEAWRQAYKDGGILEKFPHDRRLQFHPYNDMNELFCIDQSLLWDITDEFKGTAHEVTEDVCKWRFEIIKWYKNHLI